MGPGQLRSKAGYNGRKSEFTPAQQKEIRQMINQAVSNALAIAARQKKLSDTPTHPGTVPVIGNGPAMVHPTITKTDFTMHFNG